MRAGRPKGAAIPKPPVFSRLLSVWLSFIALAMALKFYDRNAGLAVLWGSSVCLAPALCFAWYVFRFRGANQARHTVNAFYRGETIKFGLTALLFALVFIRVQEVNVLAFFLSFIAAQLISGLVTAVTLGQRH